MNIYFEILNLYMSYAIQRIFLSPKINLKRNDFPILKNSFEHFMRTLQIFEIIQIWNYTLNDLDFGH